MRFFAARNQYGSDTSVGFNNTWDVLCFPSRAARDRFVDDNSSDMSVRAITKKEVTLYLTMGGQDGVKPFSGDFWAIWDGSVSFEINEKYGAKAVERASDIGYPIDLEHLY